MAEFVRRMDEADPRTPLRGIASFSKILAASDPERYAIYDARVAVSLNVVQLMMMPGKGIAFPYLPGRNKVTGDTNQKRGFSTMKDYSRRALRAEPYGFDRVTRDGAYAAYLGLLRDLSAETGGTPIYKLEMALFAQAECLVERLLAARP